MQSRSYFERLTTPGALVLASLVVLLLHPLLWLSAVGAKALPAVAAWGLFVLLVLATWAFLSEEQPESELSQRYACLLLALATLVFKGSRVLRLNRVAAWTQNIEIYALSTLVGLHRRWQTGKPAQVFVLLALTLLVERVLQRLLGQGLQLSVLHGSSPLPDNPILTILVLCAALALLLRRRPAQPGQP